MLLFIGNIFSKQGLNPGASEDLIKTLSLRYEVIFSSAKKNPFLRLTDMVGTAIANRKRCQVIIVDIFGTKAIIFALIIVLIAKLNKIPYIPILRGGSIGERYNKNPIIFNLLFSGATTIICPSLFLMQYFNSTSFPLQVIPNYIDVDKYPFKLRKHLRPNLLWVRSIHSIYNPLMAISVLEKVRMKYSNVKLCMVGPIKDDSIMKQLKILIDRLDLQDRVTFTGKMTKSEWRQLSEDYDIFINTTNYDNNPVTILEAMALGLPIVSTNVGGMPYLIHDGETGILVDRDEAKTMADRINKIISGEINAEKISLNARENVEHFDKNLIIEKWYQVIENIK